EDWVGQSENNIIINFSTSPSTRPKATSAAYFTPTAPRTTDLNSLDYEISGITGGFRFTLAGNVPEGETYSVIVSKEAIPHLKSILRGNNLERIGNDEEGKFVVIDEGEARSVVFTGLTPGASYYVYVIMLHGDRQIVHPFEARTGLEPISRALERNLPESVVYPNPSSGVFYISHAKLGSVLRVYSGLGIFLTEYVLDSAGGSVDLSAFNAGLYILELEGLRHWVILE
ncbi:MAG: T9SS type A sorting domain-containing protein, partial [Cytophagales bacterium]|nr:T9SS type A sorting domain-containing protein [Cytophagales bacterium]